MSIGRVRGGVGRLFSNVGIPTGTTGVRPIRMTSGSATVCMVSGSGRRRCSVFGVFVGRPTVPGTVGNSVDCLVGKCVSGIIASVLNTHCTRVTRRTSYPFLRTNTSSNSFLLSSAGNTFDLVNITGPNGMGRTCTTMLHRTGHVRSFKFATARCRHTGRRFLDRMSGALTGGSGVGGRRFAARCISGFVSGRPVPSMRSRDRVCGVMMPRLPLRTVGTCTGRLIYRDSAGLMSVILVHRTRNTICPARGRLTSVIGRIHSRGLRTCISGIGRRPLVTRLPGPNGVGGAMRGGRLNCGRLALSGNTGIMLGGASFGSGRVLFTTNTGINCSTLRGDSCPDVVLVART